MRSPRGPRPGRGATLGLVLAVSVLVATAALAKPPADRGNGNGKGNAPVLTLTGAVDGLLPAVPRVLDVEVHNPFPYDVLVETLEVAAGDASTSCLGSELAVGTASLPPDPIPGRGSGVAHVPVQLRLDAADGCRRATFPLTYTATAVRPPR